MSALLLYAVTDGPAARAARGTDVSGDPLRSVGEDGLVALVGEQCQPLRADRRVLEAFSAAAAAEMADRAVLPARFGTHLRDDEHVRAWLEERGEDLRAALARVSGAVEFAVRITAPAPEPAAPRATEAPGTAYLSDRGEHLRATRRLRARLEQSLAGHAREVRFRAPSGTERSVAVAFLVANDSVEAFRAAVASLAAAAGTDGAELTCTGPWPPYSFAEASVRA